MDHNQFQNLTQGLAELETERRAIQASREQIRDLIRQTQNCDGSTTAAVRNWIREVTLAFNQVGATHVVEIASKTVSGPLRFELERYVEGVIAANQIARAAIPWPDIRDHIAAQFLNLDESAALRDELEKLCQSAYEPTAQYARRFRDVADVAYPIGQRNADQERLLIRSFARGLVSDELARKLVEQTNPGTIDEAITAVTRFCERSDAYKRLGRVEVPMEVGMIKSRRGDIESTSQIDALTATVARLSTKLAKLEINNQATRASTTLRDDRHRQRSTRPAERTLPPPANPARMRHVQCYQCGLYGHLARNCKQEQSGRLRQQPGNGTTS